MSATLEPPNYELYEWLEEIADLTDNKWPAASEQEREELTARARELIDEVMTLLAAMARELNADADKPTLDELRAVEEHCRRFAAAGLPPESVDAAGHIDFGRAARGMQIIIGRAEEEIARIASQQ